MKSKTFVVLDINKFLISETSKETFTYRLQRFDSAGFSSCLDIKNVYNEEVKGLSVHSYIQVHH